MDRHTETPRWTYCFYSGTRASLGSSLQHGFQGTGQHHPPLEKISEQQVLRHQGEQPNPDTKPTELFKGHSSSPQYIKIKSAKGSSTFPQKMPSHVLLMFPGWEPLHEPLVGISRERDIAGMCLSFPSSGSRTCCLTSRWPVTAAQPTPASTLKQEKKPPAVPPLSHQRSCVTGDETSDPSR